MIWLPSNFKAALNLERAQKAEDKHEYLTEQRELEFAQKTAPNSVDVLSHLIVACYENGDFQTLFKAANTLGGKEIDDKNMLSRLNNIMEEAQLYIPDSAYSAAFSKYKNQAVPDTALQKYAHANPGSFYAVYQLAYSYTIKDKNLQADSLATWLLKQHPGFKGALNLKISVKRELNQIDSALYYSDWLLKENNQDLYALSAKARVLLKTHRNAESMQWAQQCYALSPNDAYNAATLAMIYHFNKDYKKRDELLALASKDSTLGASMTYVQDVISNKIKFQN